MAVERGWAIKEGFSIDGVQLSGMTRACSLPEREARMSGAPAAVVVLDLPSFFPSFPRGGRLRREPP